MSLRVQSFSIPSMQGPMVEVVSENAFFIKTDRVWGIIWEGRGGLFSSSEIAIHLPDLDNLLY